MTTKKKKTASTVTGEDMAREARKWLGVPFVHTGRNRWGVDCTGLLLVTAWACGITDYDCRNYSRIVNPDWLRSEIEKFCIEIEKDDIQIGDVLLFSVKGSAQHVGLVTEVAESVSPLFIHALADVGSVVEHPLRMVWAKNHVATFRWKEFCK
jgi:hypothetical protein